MRGWRKAGSQTGEPVAPGKSLYDIYILSCIYSRCEIGTVRVLVMRCAMRRRGRGGAPRRTPPSSIFFFPPFMSLFAPLWNKKDKMSRRLREHGLPLEFIQFHNLGVLCQPLFLNYLSILNFLSLNFSLWSEKVGRIDPCALFQHRAALSEWLWTVPSLKSVHRNQTGWKDNWYWTRLVGR